MKLKKGSYKISVSTPMIAAVTGFTLGVFAAHYFGKKGVLLGFFLTACLGWIIELLTRPQEQESQKSEE